MELDIKKYRNYKLNIIIYEELKKVSLKNDSNKKIYYRFLPLQDELCYKSIDINKLFSNNVEQDNVIVYIPENWSKILINYFNSNFNKNQKCDNIVLINTVGLSPISVENIYNYLIKIKLFDFFFLFIDKDSYDKYFTEI